MIARQLLTESGSIFVQIGDENVHLVRCVLDEMFGAENFVALISYSKTTTTTGEFLPATNDYLLWYAKERSSVEQSTVLCSTRKSSEGLAVRNTIKFNSPTEHAEL